MTASLIDPWGRVHSNLRISVTDRCNIRCFYCMPDENLRFLPHRDILTFEEIQRFVRIVSQFGVNKIRLTGGEPLIRAQLHHLIELLGDISGIQDVALTTNGLLLAEHAETLYKSGLNRLNISLDTLNEEIFQKISRRKGLSKVMEGIDAAIAVGFQKIRLNAISIAGLTEHEVIPLVQFAREKKLELRFIEFMPLDAEENWQSDQVLSGQKVKSIIEQHFGQLAPSQRPDPSQPAQDFHFADGSGLVGFINPVSEPFCGDCNRLRITAEGKLRNCLFSTTEWDVRSLLRNSHHDDGAILAKIRQCVAAKKEAHGIDSNQFRRPEKAMYQIGG